jgi:predicted MFS family arabinose efflux permease
VFAWLGSESHTLVGVSLVLLGLGWSAATIAASTLLVDSVPLGDRPGVQGVSDLLMNLTGAVGGALAGPVLSAFGYPGLGVACMLLVAGVVVWALLRASAPADLVAEG